MSKLLVTLFNESILVFQLGTDGRTVEIFCDSPNSKSIVGNIYAGRVENIASDMNAAFIEFEKGQNGYLRLDRSHEPYYLNKMRNDGPLRQGDVILVQVKRDPVRHKGPLLTCNIKLNDDNRSVLDNNGDARGLLWGPFEPYISYIDDFLRDNKDVQIITDISECYIKIQDLLRSKYPGLEECLSIFWDRSVSFDVVYSISSRIREATEKKVLLRSGASIVIEPTEALVSIDVNSAKSVNKTDPQKAYLAVNLEAAQEIARQIRLRNLSGMIVVDFINLKYDEDKVHLLNAFREYLADDPLKARVIDMTALGLVEITRKKVFRPLYETL